MFPHPPTPPTEHELLATAQLPHLEINKLGRTIARWTPRAPTSTSKLNNGATEALIKRIKRAGFGLRNSANYRIRVLLYAGKPNWDLLTTITPD